MSATATQQTSEHHSPIAAEWLVTAFHALIHAAGDDVRAGRMRAAAALRALRLSMHDLFRARA